MISNEMSHNQNILTAGPGLSPAAWPKPAQAPPARQVSFYPRIIIGVLVASALAAALSIPLPDSTTLQAHAEDASSVAPRPRWVDIAKPYPFYTIDAVEFSKAQKSYAAQRLDVGAGRRDMITLGNFGGAAPWLHLTIRRFGSTVGDQTDFFVDITRRAAEAGIAVSHSALPGQIATRFGPLDYASVRLERGEVAAQCQAFRFADLGPDLAITGLYCAANGHEPTPGGTVCLLDRLNLAASGDDAALRKVFVAAELKREQFCAGSKYLVADIPVASPPPLPPEPLVSAPAAKGRKRK